MPRFMKSTSAGIAPLSLMRRPLPPDAAPDPAKFRIVANQIGEFTALLRIASG
jgi:hypothetical protein